MGYHVTEIPKGTVGETSKIDEELAEFHDALLQDNQIMAVLELSDLLGAIEAWLEKHHPSISLKDLITMKAATRRAFQDGSRK